MSALADFIRDGCSARPEDKHSALAQLAALEARIEALEKENRVLRANASRSVLHRLEDQGALAAEPKLKLVDLGGGLSSYENLGRNPPEERAALAAEMTPEETQQVGGSPMFAAMRELSDNDTYKRLDANFMAAHWWEIWDALLVSLARIEALEETDAGKLRAEVDGTIRVQMSYIAALESHVEALERAAREYADAVIEGNATLGQQKRLHDLLDQKGRA